MTMVIASAYFVAGSYPREFFYSSKLGGHDPSIVPENDEQQENENRAEEEDDIEAEIVITEKREL